MRQARRKKKKLGLQAILVIVLPFLPFDVLPPVCAKTEQVKLQSELNASADLHN